MKFNLLVIFLFISISMLFAWDYDSGIIDVRTDPLASGGETRFLPYYISVCVDQPPLIVDLNLPPGDYCVDAYIRYYPCEQEHETMYANLGGQSKHIPDMGCTSFQWFYNIGDCGSDCGGDPAPLNYHTVSESSDLVFQGSGWTAEGVNIIYVRVFGNYRENTPPIVTSLTPFNGEHTDDIEINAVSSDPDSVVVSEEYQYSLDGETWLPIATSTDVESSIFWISELDECEVYLRARAFDGELYSEWFEVGPILIDNTAPITNDDAPDGWQTGEITVALTPDDGECGSGFDGDGATYYSSDGSFIEGSEVVITENGITEIEYYSIDDVGNIEEIKTCTVMLDNECPIFTDWEIPEFDEDWVGELPISLIVSDDHSGLLEHIEYYAIGASEIPGTDIEWLVLPEVFDIEWTMYEGQYLYVKSIAEDNAGNTCESSIQVEFIDPVNHPPVILSLVPTDGEFADDILVSAESSDPDGPVVNEEYQYSIDATTWLPLDILEITDDVINWTSGINECNVWFRVRAFDGELYSDWFEAGPILIDNLPPITADNGPVGWQNTDVLVELMPTDGECGSGFDESGNTYFDLGDGYLEGTEVPLSETGIYDITYYSLDDVGNEEIPHSITVYIDKECPVFAEWDIPEIDEDYLGELPISVSVTDEHSGLAVFTLYYAFSIDGSPSPEGLFWTEFESSIDVDWALHEDEYLHIKAVAADNAGNICDSDMQSEFIEYVNHPPIITALIPENGEFADNIEISATTSDPDGPVVIEEYQYSVDGETWNLIVNSGDVDLPYSWESGLDECEVYLRARAFDGELYSDWLIVGPILIDNTAPITLDNAPEGWQTENVSITLIADDGECGSGFDRDGATYYSIDDGALIEGTEISFTESGVYEITYYSIDDVGNSELPHTIIVSIDKECIVFSDWNIPDITGGTGDETCIVYTGRDYIEYTVEVGIDPTCGITGIKFEDGEPGLGEDGLMEADIFQIQVASADMPSIIEVSTKAGGTCGYTAFDISSCSSEIAIGGICEEGPDEGGFIIQLIDIEDLEDGNLLMTWRVVSDDLTTPALSHVTFGLTPSSYSDSYMTIGDYEICFGGGIAECDTFYGREDIVYVVEIGRDPTCGLTGIKFEDGEPGLGEDGAVEADIFQFNIPTGTLPSVIEISTKAGRTCGYTIFNASDCGLMAGEGGICMSEPDEGGFTIQFLAIEEFEAETRLTFRVISDDDTHTAALSHITFGVSEVYPMFGYTTPAEFVVCDESDEISCESFSVSISDDVSGIDETTTAFYWAMSPSPSITDPDMLSWTILTADAIDELIGEICAFWSENSGNYLYLMAEGSDNAGNSCYDMVNEYIDPYTITDPSVTGCGYGVTVEFPALLRALDAIGYNVYRSSSPQGKFDRVNNEPIVSSSFRDQPKPGLWYYKIMKILPTMEEVQYGEIFEIQTYEVTSSNLRAELLNNAQVRLIWNAVPEAYNYNVYNGPEDDIDFRAPLETIHLDTTWVSPIGLLRAGETYSFNVQIMPDCDCPSENITNTITITPTNEPLLTETNKANITNPHAGSYVSGDFFTVVAEPTLLHDNDITSLKFQIRRLGDDTWNDIDPSEPIVDLAYSGNNPDFNSPYYLNMNTSLFTEGTYQVRALTEGYDTRSGTPPSIVTFNILHENSIIKEDLSLNTQDILFTAAPDRIIKTSLGSGISNNLIDGYFTVYGEPCQLNIKRVAEEILPYPYPDSRTIVGFKTSLYSGQKPERIVSTFDIHYDEGELSDHSIREEELKLYIYRDGSWESLPVIIDFERNIVHAQVEEFGLFILGPNELLSVAERIEIPETNVLVFAHPNPFNSTVMITAMVPEDDCELAIFNVMGEKLITLETKVGSNRIMWNGRDELGNEMPSGIYLLRLDSRDVSQVKKLILMK